MLIQVERLGIVAGLLYGVLVFPCFRRPALSGLYVDAPVKRNGKRNIAIVLTVLGRVIYGEPFDEKHYLAPLNAYVVRQSHPSASSVA